MKAIKLLSSIAIIFVFSIILIFIRMKKAKQSKLIVLQSSNCKVSEFCDQYNLEQNMVTEKAAVFQKLEFKTFKITVSDMYITVFQFYEVKNSTKIPIVMLPHLNGHAGSKPIQQLAQQFVELGHQVFVLPCNGVSNQLPEEQPLVNEYLDFRDLEALLKEFVKEKCILVGLSAGTMKALHFLDSQSQQVAKIQKFAALWGSYDPLMPTLLSDEVQEQIGGQYLKFARRNLKCLLHNHVSPESLNEFALRPTMLGYDQCVWADRLGLNIEDYYAKVSPTDKFAAVTCECLIMSEKRDNIAGQLLPDAIVKGMDNVSLIVHQGGNHLQNQLASGGTAFGKVLAAWL